MRLGTADCRHRFASARVARLATVGTDGRPHLVPVTFAVEGDAVVVAVDHKPKSTTELRRMRNVAEHPAVAFLVDEYGDDWSRLWWVRCDATGTVVASGTAWESAIDALVVKYEQYQQVRPSGPVLIGDVDRWSGWAASGWAASAGA